MLTTVTGAKEERLVSKDYSGKTGAVLKWKFMTLT